jgi:RNA polymerase sigma-70 factor (ECF subfamily)
MGNDMQTLADKLVPVGGTRLRRSQAITESPEEQRVVAQAVARAKAGDREAIRYLYLRYANNVYGYVRSIVHDDYEAEDITQHVFAKLMTVIDRYEPLAVPFSRWLLRLAHNAAVDYLRACNTVPCEEVRTADEQADEGWADRSSSLRSALAELSDDQRNVVVLRHLAGFSPGEIAERMHRTESSIHGLHHRARGALRTRLEQLESGPATARVVSG